MDCTAARARAARLAIGAFAAGVLVPARAMADAGVPMLVLLWPAAWALLVPIVRVEAWCARRIMGTGWREALIVSAQANAASTLLGIPMAWM